MILTQLQLQHFRNYQRLDLFLKPGQTLLYGPNAGGKTNIVEAIYTLATTKSFRARADREMITRGSEQDSFPFPFARLQGDATTDSGEQTRVEILISAPAVNDGPPGATRKQFRLNGAPKRAGDVVGQLKAVLFSPSDVDIVAGSPSARRRYIDLMLCQVDRSYLRLLQTYSRIVQQRNSALTANNGSAYRSVIEILDDKLVSEGSQIIARRLEMIEALSEYAAKIYTEIAGAAEDLSVSYASTIGSTTERGTVSTRHASDNVIGVFQEQLKAERTRSREQRVTAIGPHRDDLNLTLDGEPVIAYGSRGQQRTVSLALKMAEARYMRDRTGQEPILLLDEALSELDDSRRRHLLGFISQAPQVILTGTSDAPFKDHVEVSAQLLRVDAGKIETA